MASDPLLQKLEGAGCHKDDLEKIQELINAKDSDLFDVLEYVAYAKAPMSITPYLPDQIRQGSVFTWVNSQWEFMGLPGQFSTQINKINTDRNEASLSGAFLLSAGITS